MNNKIKRFHSGLFAAAYLLGLGINVNNQIDEQTGLINKQYAKYEPSFIYENNDLDEDKNDKKEKQR